MRRIDVMLCQDYLSVRPLTEAGHADDEPCECGGDFPNCPSCEMTAQRLAARCRDASALGLRITSKGARQGVMRTRRIILGAPLSTLEADLHAGTF